MGTGNFLFRKGFGLVRFGLCVDQIKTPGQRQPQQDSLHNKRVISTKNEPQQQGISYLEREREGVRERER